MQRGSLAIVSRKEGPAVCQFRWSEEGRIGGDVIPLRAGLLLLGCPLSPRCGVGRHRGADELLEGSFVDILLFAKVDRTPRVPFQAGVE